MNYSEKKVVFTIVLVCLVTVALGYYLWWKSSNAKIQPVSNFTEKVDSGMSEEQKKIFTDRIEKNTQRLSLLLTDDSTKILRFQILQSIGGDLYSLGELKQAREKYLECANLIPEDPIIWYSLANTEYRMNDFVSALTHIDKALVFSPKVPEYWILKFDILRSAEKPVVEVRQQIADGLKATGNNTDIITYYARFLENIGKTDEAVEKWREAQRTNPDGRQLYQNEIDNLTR